MPLPDLIAYYLAVNYPAALEPFIQAAGLAPPDLANPPEPDLRSVVEHYVSNQIASDIGAVTIHEKVVDGSWSNWSANEIVKLDLPKETRIEKVVRTIDGVSAANLLTVGVFDLPKRRFDLPTATYCVSYNPTIIISSVDKTLKLLDYATGEVDLVFEPHKAAILSFAVHPMNPRYIVSGSMDGTTVLTDIITRQSIQSFVSSKFVVRVAFSEDGRYLATASYDRHIVVYEAMTSALSDDEVLDETDDRNLACDPSLSYQECHRLQTDSNPEAIAFTSDWLLYTLRSSHLLYHLRLGSWTVSTKSFNPHPMDTHVSFSVLNLAVHPSGKVVACQTGDHRGGSGERILLYDVDPGQTERLGCLWTGTDSDDFVLPRMAWLPDGRGLITTTPYGFLKLVTLKGEVRSNIKVHGASDLGQGSSEIVRDCCVRDNEVISVGYDKKIRISK